MIESIRLVKVYLKHNNFEKAIKVCSEVLEGMSKDEEDYPYVLLEYSICLLENINFETENNYKRILFNNYKINTGINFEEIDEDLEICWDSLETCRVLFKILNDNESLIKVYKYLGDLLNFNNKFDEAIEEYKKSLELITDKNDLVEIYDSIADTYISNKKIKEAILYYKKIISITNDENKEKYKNKINEINK